MKTRSRYLALAMLMAFQWLHPSFWALAAPKVSALSAGNYSKMAPAPMAVFSIISPTASTVVNAGSTLNVTWDVAGSTGSPIFAANVSIFLFVDAYPTGYALALSTPNDGAHTVTIPNGTKSNQATIRIIASGSGGSVNASSSGFTISGATGSFCQPLGGGCTSDLGNASVISFQVTNSTGSTLLFSNASGCGIEPGNPSYSNYSPNPALRPSLGRGTTYRLVSTGGCTSGPQCLGVGYGYYIDLNRDGTFNGTGEYIGGTDPATGPVALNWTVPTSYTEGFYRFRVKSESSRKPLANEACGGFNNSGEAEDYLVFISNYCAPSYENGCIMSFINSFSLGSYNNSNSGCANQGLSGNYSLTTGPGLLDNSSYSFGVTIGGTFGAAFVGIYIDFNNDFDFNDAGEMVFLSSAASLIHSGLINIPSGISGTRRIRVRSSTESLTNDGPCGTRINGETEDYNVVIGSGVIAAGNQTVCQGGDPNNITFSTAPATGSTYQWYSRSGLVAAPAPADPVTGWTLLTGQTGSSYNPPAGQTTNITFACRITLGGVGRWANGVRQVTVLPTFNPGTLAAGNQTFSESGQPNAIAFSTAPTGGTTYAYRWYEADGLVAAPTGTTIPSNWRVISGATSSSYTPPVVYQNKSFATMVDPTGTPDCGGFTWAGGVRQITVSNGCLAYCLPDRTGLSPNSALSITSVTLGSQTQTSGFNNHYANFGLSNFFLKNSTLNYSVTASSTSITLTRYFGIWADWNRDGAFSGLNELINLSGGTTATSFSGSTTIPSTAVTGRTSIRVFVVAGFDPSSNSCPSLASDLFLGEVEDYCIYISNGLTPGTVTAGNQTLCNGQIPNAMPVTGFSPTSGVTFQWYSRDGIIAAPGQSSSTQGWTLISGATSATYTPTSPLASTQTFACRVSANGSSLWASGVRQVTVRPPFNAGTLAAGNQTFTGGSGDPAPITFATAPTGAGTFAYRWYSAPGIQSAPIGTIVPAGWTLISGQTSSSFDPPVISSTTSYAAMVDATGTPDCGPFTWASGVRQITIVPAGFSPGVINGFSETVCNGGDPSPIVFSEPASAGSSFQWYFQNGLIAAPANNDPIGSWTILTGQTSSTLDLPSGQVQSRTYACRVTLGANSQWATGVGQVNVLPVFNPGTLASGNQSFTGSGDPAAIFFSTPPSGGTGSSSYSYKWYARPGIHPAPTGIVEPPEWTYLGWTGTSFDPPVQSASVSFAVMVRPAGSENCAPFTWASGVRQITINSVAFNPGILATGDQTVCNGAGPASVLFSTAPTAGSTYQWYYRDGLVAAPANTDPIGPWLILSGQTGSILTPGATFTSRTFACRVTNGSNSQWANGARQVTVLPAFNPGTITAGDQSFCNSGDPANITLSANPVGSGGYTWRWYFRENSVGDCPSGSTVPTGWTTNNTSPNITGTTFDGTGISFDPQSAGALNAGRTFAVLITPIANGVIPACGTPQWANSCRRTSVTSCTGFTPGVLASGNQTLCSPASPATIAFSTAPTAGSTFQWYFQNGIVAAPANTDPIGSWSVLTGQTSNTLSPGTLTASRTFACRVTNGSNSQWATGVRQITVNPGVTSYGDVVLSGPGYHCEWFTINSNVFTVQPLPSGGTGSFSYQWFYRLGPSGTDVPISGQTSTTYTFSPSHVPSQDQYMISCVVTPAGGCGTPTRIGLINFFYGLCGPFNPGAIQSANQTICQAGDPAPVVYLNDFAGTFQYYYRDGIVPAPGADDPIGSWISISDPTASGNSASGATTSYDPPAGLTVSRTYARRLTLNSTSKWSAGVQQVTVLPAFSPGAILANINSCPTAFDPAPITMTANAQGSGQYKYTWYYIDNNTATCPTVASATAGPSGWTTSATDNRFFGISTTGAGISFDATSTPTTGRTWVLRIIPEANGAIPACGTVSYTNCNRTQRATSCREAVDGLGEVHKTFSLSQNVPNPFSQETAIQYVLPEGIGNGILEVYSLNGKVHLSVSVAENTEGEIKIEKGKLAPGAYFYRIRTEKSVSQTLKMVIQ